LAAATAWASSTRIASQTSKTATPGHASLYKAFEGPISGLERDLFADAADGSLDHHTPLAAALIASGLSDANQVRRYEDRLDAWIAQLDETDAVEGTGIDEAAAIFEFMHTRILVGGYSRDTSDPREALGSGRFNCASASLLYYCLAEHFGFDVRGLELPGHAMIRLTLADQTFDVETTCPRWFQLRDDPQAQARLLARVRGKRSGADASGPREVTPIQMAAMIYYNRGIDLLAGRRYPEALAANAKALRLDPASVTARGNLLATLNNWSIHLGEAAHYAEAVERLDAGLAIDPQYPAFAANYVHVHYQWAHALCRAKQFAEAVSVLEQAIAHRPDDGYFRRVLADVYRRWATRLYATAPAEEAFALFDAAYRRFGRQPGLLAAEIAAANDRALTLIEQGRFMQALTLIDRALTRLPDAALLDENRRVAVMRWAEPAFLEGDYAEAIRRTTYGAQPGQLHESLRNNVRYGYQQWVAQLESAGQAAEARRVAGRAQTDPFLSGR
jgi:tetratricopeptide (TPR) repeat protein